LRHHWPAAAQRPGLRPGLADRQRLQVALTSQGFDTRGSDGAFGPRSREMIAGWQKARSLPPTGFLNAAQHQALMREAATALGKYDDEQKKLEEDKEKTDEAKRKADEEAKAKAAGPAVSAAPASPSAPPPQAAAKTGSSFDGTYSGSLVFSGSSAAGQASVFTASLQLAHGRLTGDLVDRRCGAFPIAVTVSPTGEISGSFRFMGDAQCSMVPSTASGRISGSQLQLDIRAGQNRISGSLGKSGD
jgi:peptidoglycan hydrolase-like protein with peptidoglycan-binding domain